jgi:hypothetical protein
MPGVLRLEENTLPVVVLHIFCHFFLHFLLRVSAAPIIGGMGGFSFLQPAVAACWSGRFIFFLGALLLQVTASAAQLVGRLLAVCPDVA